MIRDFLIAAALIGGFSEALFAQTMVWTRLPSLPDPIGFAGPFAGVVGDALLVAGGANFPDLMPWQGGVKVWREDVFLLDDPGDTWRRVGKLPRPSAHGVSISTSQGVACLGGGDLQRCHAECFLLHWEKGTLGARPMPSLPASCANACGAELDGVVYVAGGVEHPNDAKCLRTFWALDLQRMESGWRKLETWPGPERMLSVAAILDGSFFLISGASLHAGSDAKPRRTWLRDAYRYDPGRGWKRIADLPRAAVAAPSPAIALDRSRLQVLGGDDGRQIDSPPREHSGFPRHGLLYDAAANAWNETQEAPFSFVASPIVSWKGRFIVPGGESRPGVRSTHIWSGKPKRASLSDR